ncbi:MAG: beta-lactamase family protein [Bacteroidetes bacterium]|nr:beta-lactamase family protein [Bacteroidota bacterium]
MKRTLVVGLSLLLCVRLNAQEFDKEKMDSLFNLIESNGKGMGSISLYQDGNEVYYNSFGYADLANNIKATEKTKYRIGSVSKIFTATIIMQLVDEKKLSLVTTIDQYFPNLPNANKITIEQLLRHRSGLHNFTNDKDYLSWMESPKTKSELIEIFIEKGYDFEPNEKYEYSNTNYVLLSFIAESIDNKSFSEILKNRIIEPLKLKDTYYGNKINTKENEALSYTKLNEWHLSPETDMSVPVGAGAVVSTPSDLNIFLNNLFTGNLVSPNSLEQMKDIVEGYGIGMFQMPFYDKKSFGHTGGIDGFQSIASYFPKENFSISYCSNGVVMSKNDILLGALSIYFGKDYQLPNFKPTIELTSEDLDQYLGIYSSTEFPLKITISKENNVLIAQATGQSAFPLEAYELHKFKFDQAMLKLEFLPKENKMILKQGGGEFELKKEE